MKLFVKNLIFTVLVPGAVAGWLPAVLARDAAPASAPWLVAGSALLAAGAAIYLWCLWDFASAGRGTPAPIDPPRTLVVRGLYRYTRNPMYLGVLTAIAGWVALYGSLALLGYGACVALAFHLFVVIYEEPALARRFGADYERYRTLAPRWLTRPGRRRGA